MDYHRVSIIILNWNGLSDTIECLESLKKITYPNYEVIVVDNDSRGNDADILEERYKGYIKVIRNKENLGFAGGNNVAIKQVLEEKKGKYILLLNNDTVVEPNFLDELIRCAECHPQAGSFQAKIIFSWNKKLIDCVGIEYSKNSLTFNRGAYENIEKYNKKEEIFGCSPAGSLYNIKALEDIKINEEFFDEDFFLYFEDTDIALRLQWAGWKSWYCPKAIIYHFRGGTYNKNPMAVYYIERNRVFTLFKNLPFNFIIKNFPRIIFAEIGRTIVSLIREKKSIIYILKTKFDLLKGFKKNLEKRKKIKKRVNFSELEKWFISKWKTKIPRELIKNKK